MDDLKRDLDVALRGPSKENDTEWAEALQRIADSFFGEAMKAEKEVDRG